MQQCVQQQHRRADARRDQREGQHVQRRHPAQMRVQQAERQHQAQHRHRRDHRVGMGHGAHQRAREGGEGAGEAVDRLAIAAMRAASVAEGLDHGYAVDELDRGVVDAAEPFHEFLHVRAAGLHGAAQEQEEARKRQQRDDGQAPVHGEQVGRRRHDGARRASHGGVEVRGQAVQRGDVVLQHLLDLARGALREPAQRHLGQPPRGQAQMMGEAVVGQVGGQFAGQDQRHAREQADHAGDDQRPDVAAGAAQGDLRDSDHARQRRQRQRGACRGQRRRQHQAGADGRQGPADRGGRVWAGRGRVTSAHGTGASRNTELAGFPPGRPRRLGWDRHGNADVNENLN